MAHVTVASGLCEDCGQPGTCLFRWADETPPGRPFCDDCCEHDGGCTKSPDGQGWGSKTEPYMLAAREAGRRDGFLAGCVMGAFSGLLLGLAAHYLLQVLAVA